MRLTNPCLTLLALAAVFMPVGCGSSSPDAPASTTTPDSPPLVTYTKSGGLAGIYEHVSVAASGKTTVSQGLTSRSKSQSFTLTDDQLASLRQTLDAARLGSLKSASPQGCADCFIYEISYDGSTFRSDEATLPNAAKPAVSALNLLIAKAGVEEPLATGK